MSDAKSTGESSLQLLLSLHHQHSNRMGEADGRHCIHYTKILMTVNTEEVSRCVLQQPPADASYLLVHMLLWLISWRNN